MLPYIGGAATAVSVAVVAVGCFASAVGAAIKAAARRGTLAAHEYRQLLSRRYGNSGGHASAVTTSRACATRPEDNNREQRYVGRYGKQLTLPV